MFCFIKTHVKTKTFSLVLTLCLNRDTLFKEDFSLKEVKKRFADVQAKCEDSCVVLSYLCRDEGEPLQKSEK